MLFLDRQQAGRALAARLAQDLASAPLVVLGLPRGGVPVAYEVACALEAPLDVFLVRKLGVPGHEELAMGAVAEGGFRMLNRQVVESVGVTAEQLRLVEQRQTQELQRQQSLFRRGRARPPLVDRTVILVDDGLATGATMQVAAQAVAAQRPKAVWVAVPVAPPDTCRALQPFADRVICLHTPAAFASVGSWYRDFQPVSDQQVIRLLDLAAARHAAAP